MRNFEESLFFFREISQLDARLEDPLSIQRVEGGTESRTPDLVMKDAQIQVTTEDNRHVRIMSDLTLQVGKDGLRVAHLDRKSTRLNSSHVRISYAVFCLINNTMTREYVA